MTCTDNTEIIKLAILDQDRIDNNILKTFDTHVKEITFYISLGIINDSMNDTTIYIERYEATSVFGIGQRLEFSGFSDNKDILYRESLGKKCST